MEDALSSSCDCQEAELRAKNVTTYVTNFLIGLRKVCFTFRFLETSISSNQMQMIVIVCLSSHNQNITSRCFDGGTWF